MILLAQLHRIRLFGAAGAVVLATVSSGCLGPDEGDARLGNPFLHARPGTPSRQATLGESALGLGSGRDGLLYVPASYDPGTPIRLLVALHAAGQDDTSFAWLFAEAETRGFALLVPESRAGTWDLVRGPFGPDVEFIDLALEYTFERVRVTAGSVAFLGVGDGGAYALSLGVSNGDLLGSLTAFGPGFFEPVEVRVGKPRVFIAHGVDDTAAAVSISRDIIVPRLRGEGYEVEYQEFQGGAEVPPAVASAALDWLLN